MISNILKTRYQRVWLIFCVSVLIIEVLLFKMVFEFFITLNIVLILMFIIIIIAKLLIEWVYEGEE